MPQNENYTNGWNEYKLLVMSQLEGLDKKLDSLEKKIDELKTKVTIIETRSVFFGVIGGFIITIIFQLILLFIKN